MNDEDVVVNIEDYYDFNLLDLLDEIDEDNYNNTSKELSE